MAPIISSESRDSPWPNHLLLDLTSPSLPHYYITSHNFPSMEDKPHLNSRTSKKSPVLFVNLLLSHREVPSWQKEKLLLRGERLLAEPSGQGPASLVLMNCRFILQALLQAFLSTTSNIYGGQCREMQIVSAFPEPSLTSARLTQQAGGSNQPVT